MTELKKQRKKIRHLLVMVIFLFMMVPSASARASSEHDLTVVFLNAYGQLANLPSLTIPEDGKALLPVAPADPFVSGSIRGKPAWKSAINGTDYMVGGNYLSYATAKSIAELRQTGNVVYLYSTRAFTISYHDNAGTKTIGNSVKAYEGTTITLKQNPTTNVLNKGWSRYKNGTGVWAKFGSQLYVESDLKLYLVTYARVTYLTQDGKTTISIKEVKKGSTVKLAAPPSYSDYRVYGWNIYTNKSSAKYKTGDIVTITANARFYVARKYLPYTVTFLDGNGKTSAALSKLNLRCLKNEAVILPAPPVVTGKNALGWALKKGEDTAEFKEKDSCKITKNITFYAVYKKAAQYTVTFVNAKGESNKNFESLNKKVYEGTIITLPDLPSSGGNYSKGWNLTLNGNKKLYTAGTTIKVNGNYTFYAYYVQAAKVVLHYNNGEVFQTITLEKGTSFTLPAMENPSGYTFMGWDRQKDLLISPASPRNVAFEAGEKTPGVSGTLDLYAVLFQRNREGSVTYSQLIKANNGKYSRIIFVGDSRTVRMKAMLVNNMRFTDSSVSYIASSGQGLSWLQGDGIQRLTALVDKTNQNPSGKIAVVFNLGVNDLQKYAEYIAYLKSLGQELVRKNCELFFLSVNPINSVMIRKQGFGSRSENDVRTFNAALSKGLSGLFTYIDTYSWLVRTGYSTDRGEEGYNTGVDDGLHYALNTYKRIYLRVIQTICS